MNMTLDMMAGPTDQARALQLAQHVLCERLYETWREVDQTLTIAQCRKEPVVIEAQKAYEANVAELVALLGVNAPCHQVDSDLWECFHNVYKSDVGCRPGAGWSWTQVKEYLERSRIEQEQEDAAAAATASSATTP
jgi:hypothetical protein